MWFPKRENAKEKIKLNKFGNKVHKLCTITCFIHCLSIKELNKGWSYCPEPFRPILSYCPEPFRSIASYCPEPFRPITSYFLEPFRPIESYCPEPLPGSLKPSIKLAVR